MAVFIFYLYMCSIKRKEKKEILNFPPILSLHLSDMRSGAISHLTCEKMAPLLPIAPWD